MAYSKVHNYYGSLYPYDLYVSLSGWACGYTQIKLTIPGKTSSSGMLTSTDPMSFRREKIFSS